MAIHPLAGKPAPVDILIDVAAVNNAYYERQPDTNNPLQLVSFGTSGHRGSALDGTFNEAHVVAISQAICEYPSEQTNFRAAFHGQGHARAFWPGAAQCARSPSRKRRRNRHRA